MHCVPDEGPNLSDYFPILKFVDPRRIVRETGVYFSKLMAMIW